MDLSPSPESETVRALRAGPVARPPVDVSAIVRALRGAQVGPGSFGVGTRASIGNEGLGRGFAPIVTYSGAT